MTPDPDELLRQIMDAGLYGQRQKPLQQRYQLGQQFLDTPAARGANVGSTYVASSPMEHAANALRQFMGARMMNQAQAGQQDLTTRLGADRSAYAKALQGMGGKPGELMPGGEGDTQGQQHLAMLGSLSGDPGMENAAKTALQERHLGVQESQMQNLLRHQQILEGQGQQKIGQTERQQKTVFDGFNNPVTTPTHAPTNPPSVLPRSTAAAGGGAQPSGNGDPAKTYPFGRGGPNQAAIDKYAEQMAVTGQIPPGKWGKASAAVNSAISNRMTELYPDVNLSENKAGYISNMNSQRKMQLTADSIDAFEGTALKNGKLMLDAAKNIVDVGSPFFNKPLRAIQQQFAGDPRMTKFNAARQVFVQEAGRVLGGAVAGGALTEGQRHEVEGLVSGSATIPQMEATLQTLEADMANRKAATQAGLQAIRGRMSMKPGGAQAAAPPAAPAPAGGAPQLSPKDAAAVEAARKRLQTNPQDATALQVLKLNGITQ